MSKILPSAIIIITLIVIVLFGGLIIHELGHGITAQILGGEFKALYVFPGIQLWPNIGQPYNGEWGLNVGRVLFDPGEDWNRWQKGMVSLMGSGATMIVAILALVILWIIRPKRWFSYILIGNAFLYLDILCYTILPEWFGLRHWIFFGGSYPEPLEGAVMMGCNRQLFLIFILLISSLMTFGVVKYIAIFLKTNRQTNGAGNSS